MGAFSQREIGLRHAHLTRLRWWLLGVAKAKAEDVLQEILGCGKRQKGIVGLDERQLCGVCRDARKAWSFLGRNLMLGPSVPGSPASLDFGAYNEVEAKALLGDHGAKGKAKGGRAFLAWLAAEAAAIADYGLHHGQLEEMRSVDDAMFQRGYFAALLGDPVSRQHVAEYRAKMGPRAAEARHKTHIQTKVKPFRDDYCARLAKGERSSDIIEDMAKTYGYPTRRMRELIKPRARKREISTDT